MQSSIKFVLDLLINKLMSLHSIEAVEGGRNNVDFKVCFSKTRIPHFRMLGMGLAGVHNNQSGRI